ncbi:PaaX family transcriptional regulator C-terminal domain-containing protein [Nocardia terpenica]|uniref:PaaX domain-containing protein, C-domain protein n=1 Tax=Nocardia terpenica TaxID=455432 RepID=A0A6G9ZHJ2_9NOCA|nr:PaaX family transcriptional regulator C-terminal domain-containing protein [Nocardia terpenica]QIS24463.1 PaaX domain-containing protein, C- domain protein [Nocardia terpenica]
MRPLSARSVILSVLLGAHPPEAPVAELITFAEAFGIQPTTTRVALTRMVAAGDLDRTDTTYRLTPRLLARQQHQDRMLSATVEEPWDRTWRTVIVVSSGDPAPARAALRTSLRDHRFAELREGVWIRPHNIDLDWRPADNPRVETLTATPDTDPHHLAQRLFDLTTWAETATTLITAMDHTPAPMARLTIAAAIVRHLLTDPLMPTELVPDTWPAAHLRATYANYRHELADLRNSLLQT